MQCTAFLERIVSKNIDYGLTYDEKKNYFVKLVYDVIDGEMIGDEFTELNIYKAFMSNTRNRELMREILGFDTYTRLAAYGKPLEKVSPKKKHPVDAKSPIPKGCELTKRLAGYSKDELEEIAKKCGISIQGKAMKDLYTEITLKLRSTDYTVSYDVAVNGVMLAEDYIGKKTGKPVIANVKGWLASEKYDGVRAVWNGNDFISRSGATYEAPKWFKALMPKVALDGELFMGRDTFQATVSVVRKNIPVDKEWAKIKYQIFDAPAIDSGAEERIAYYTKIVNETCKNFHTTDAAKHMNECPLIATEQHVLRDEKDLNDQYDKILELKGEGMMLRQPGSKYIGKRSKVLLKYKPLFDAEAVIVGYEGGTGRNADRLGAFFVEDLKDRTKKFKVGTGLSDEVRDNYKRTHKIGTIITYGYAGLTNKGLPRQPKYIRVRTDL